jgi:hypothetical protein
VGTIVLAQCTNVRDISQYDCATDERKTVWLVGFELGKVELKALHADSKENSVKIFFEILNVLKDLVRTQSPIEFFKNFYNSIYPSLNL